MNLYRFSISLIFPAETPDEGRELFEQELEDRLYELGDASDWDCEQLPRNVATEYLFRSFEAE